MMSFDEDMTKAVAEQVVADAAGVDLADAPNNALFGYDPIKKLTDSDSSVAAKAQNVYAANQQLMALGNVAGGSATYIGQQALSAAQSAIQTVLDNNGLSAASQQRMIAFSQAFRRYLIFLSSDGPAPTTMHGISRNLFLRAITPEFL